MKTGKQVMVKTIPQKNLKTNKWSGGLKKQPMPIQISIMTEILMKQEKPNPFIVPTMSMMILAT